MARYLIEVPGEYILAQSSTQVKDILDVFASAVQLDYKWSEKKYYHADGNPEVKVLDEDQYVPMTRGEAEKIEKAEDANGEPQCEEG